MVFHFKNYPEHKGRLNLQCCLYTPNWLKIRTPESINNVVSQTETQFLSASESSFGFKCKINDINTKNSNKKKWFNRECRVKRNSYHTARKLYNIKV